MTLVEDQPVQTKIGTAVSYEGGKILSFYQDAKKLAKGELVIPRMISVWLTHYCNLACGYCLYAWTHSQLKGIPAKEFHEFIDEIAYAGVESLEFAGGGEPALHPSCFEFAEHARKVGLRVGMLTNGTHYKFDEVIGNFEYLRIGIDAVDDTQYKLIKSPKAEGQFDNVVENTRKLLHLRGSQQRPRIGFKFLLGKKNYESLRSMVALSRDVGVDYVHFKAEHNSPDELSPYERDITEKSLKNLKVLHPGFVLGSVVKARATVPTCFMAPIHTVMDAHGNLLVCCYFNLPEKNSFGNALKDGFEKVWFSEKHLELQKSYTQAECDQFDCRFHLYNQKMQTVLQQGDGDLSFI